MWERYRDDVQFYVVYIREAHALESPVALGSRGVPPVEEPLQLDERRRTAAACRAGLSLEPIEMLVDGLDDAVEAAYAAHPDRLYLIGRDGRIAYHGYEGPAGMRPEELAHAIEEELARNP